MTRWFAAVVVLQSQVGSGWDDEPLLDHQVRLIDAPSAEAAYDQALQLGKQEEHEYRNADGERVRWQFLGLEDLVELLGPPVSGGEIYSWSSTRSDDEPIVPKNQLTVFWLAANAHKRASDLLE
jgi:hypothetical protein